MKYSRKKVNAKETKTHYKTLQVKRVSNDRIKNQITLTKLKVSRMHKMWYGNNHEKYSHPQITHVLKWIAHGSDSI
jgi:hypothetical protein